MCGNYRNQLYIHDGIFHFLLIVKSKKAGYSDLFCFVIAIFLYFPLEFFKLSISDILLEVSL